jgi:hypothetical protein
MATDDDELNIVVVGVFKNCAVTEAVGNVTVDTFKSSSRRAIVEYAVHTVKRLGLEPVLVSYGTKETVLDLGFNLISALLVLGFGDRILKISRPVRDRGRLPSLEIDSVGVSRSCVSDGTPMLSRGERHDQYGDVDCS